MNKIKIYLDTSVVSHLKAEDTPEKMSDTLEFWDILKENIYEVYISDLTLSELSKCLEPKKTILDEFLARIEYMDIDENKESIILADEYLKHGVLNEKSRDDCRHISLATVIGCKYIISWNFKHFVNIKVINKVQAVNKLNGYDEIAILPPSMFLKGDEELW